MLHFAGLVSETVVWEALRSGPVPSGGQGVALADPCLSGGVVEAWSLRVRIRLGVLPLSFLYLLVGRCQL